MIEPTRKEIMKLDKHEIHEIVNICPYCGKGIVPVYVGHVADSKKLVVMYSCPACEDRFLSIYENKLMGITQKYRWCFSYTNPNKWYGKIFDDDIKSISEEFCNIYSQVQHAESLGVKEICGLGYRKALEFLIKDYAKYKNPEDIEKIDELYLKQCIAEYIDDDLKIAIKGIGFIGNEKEYYTRKYSDKDIKDLKLVIDIFISFIKTKELLKIYIENL